MVLKFFLSQTSMLLQYAVKGWNSLCHRRSNLWAAELGIYYSNVYRKMPFAPLNILASVFKVLEVSGVRGTSFNIKIRSKFIEIKYSTPNKVLTAKLLRQGYRYHKIRKAFSKFYRRHFDIVSKYNVGLKTLLLEGLSEPEFYGDLVYKFRKIIGNNDFPYHFKKIIVRYKKIGYNVDVLRQTACLVVNPIKVNSFAYLFNCTTVGRASD